MMFIILAQVDFWVDAVKGQNAQQNLHEIAGDDIEQDTYNEFDSTTIEVTQQETNIMRKLNSIFLYHFQNSI